MTKPDSDYQRYLEGELLRGRYLKVRALNEGSFGIVSIAEDTNNDSQLVAVKYNTGRLADFASYESSSDDDRSPRDNGSPNNEVKSFSLNSKTKSNAYTSNSSSSSASSNSNDKDFSKSIVLRETNHEVAMLKKVDSCPNITKLIDNFDTFMVLEYASRGDLHDAIQQGMAPVATADVIDVFNQLINAVEYCHKNGVYHRDIKPENILITQNWTIKLTDFGLATDQLICTDFDVGSERYMAPELLEHSDIDSYAADKVDIWSLGIVLLNIVFGKSPFRSACSKDKMFLYFAANRDTLFDIFPFMSYDLFTIMINSLTIDPANRDLEMIKMNLKCVDILTYDYEFEEEVDDKDTTANGISKNNNTTLVEEPNEDDSIIDEDTKETITNENTETIPPPNTSPILSSPFVVESSPSYDGSNEKRTASLPNQSRKSTTPIIHVTDDDQINSIDTLIANDNSDNDEDNIGADMATSTSKPIAIESNREPSPRSLPRNPYDDKQYPVDQQRVSKYSTVYNSINSHSHNSNATENNFFNKDHNYRAKRWTPAHRKPLKIANYNHRNRSQDGRYRGGRDSFKEESFDFNRRDFFTPKSVLSNYMENAFKNKQQLQQKGNYYRRFKDSDANGYNYKYRNNNGNSYHNSYENRRAWQQRKRRYSVLNYNSNNNNNNYNNNYINHPHRNRGSFNYPNSAPRNARSSLTNWSYHNNSHGEKSFLRERRMSAHVPGSAKFMPSDRRSMDGKYVPPNMRINASSLMGSAIMSDDEFDADNENEHEHANQRSTDEDRSEEEEFAFEFEGEGSTMNKKHENSEDIRNTGADNSFYGIQSTAINLVSKQFSDSKIFDERENISRNTSSTTTTSNNVSSIGSNHTTSPKGYKKYVPPHQRRSSHSGAEMPKNLNIPSSRAQHVPYSGNNMNSKIGKMSYHDGISGSAGDDYLAHISMSAPTKSTSFFNAMAKPLASRDIVSQDSKGHGFEDDQSDDLFNIEET